MTDAAEILRRARRDAGLSQAELGRRAEVTQPVISAYEAGRRAPSLATLVKLVEASGNELRIDLTPRAGAPRGLPDTAMGRRLRRHRRAVVEAAAGRGATNVRVFGSVARGDDTGTSDLDLLVDLAEGSSLFDLSALARELGDLLRVVVDVVPADGLRPHLRTEVLREAIPL